MAELLLRGTDRASGVQLDLELVAPAPGFTAVPVGPHRISVLAAGRWDHRWVDVPTPDATVLVGGPAAARAPSSASLAPFPTTRAATWAALTRHLCGTLPRVASTGGAPLEARLPATGGGAVTALVRAAGGADALLAELERRFVEGFLTPDAGDLEAIAGWRRLVGMLAGARRSDADRWPGLFAEAVAVFGHQVGLLGVDLLDDALVYELELLAAELVRAVEPDAGLAGIALGALLER